MPFLCFSPIIFFFPFFFFFFFFSAVEVCRQLVEKPRGAGEMLVHCGMRLPLGDPRRAGSEWAKWKNEKGRRREAGTDRKEWERRKEGGGNGGARFPFSEAMTAGSVLPHMTECCGEEYLSWKPASKGGQLILFYFFFQALVRWSLMTTQPTKKGLQHTGKREDVHSYMRLGGLGWEVNSPNIV